MLLEEVDEGVPPLLRVFGASVDVDAPSTPFAFGPEIDGPHDAAGGAMPGQSELSRAALDCVHDLVGDVLVDVETIGLHGQFSAERWAGFRQRGLRPDAGDRLGFGCSRSRLWRTGFEADDGPARQSVRGGRLCLVPPLGWSLDRAGIGQLFWRLHRFAGRALGRQADLRRVQFQLAVDQPEIAVAAMQGVRMRWVAEPDHFDDVFQREIDEAGLAVLRLSQLRLIGLRGILDVIVQVRRDHDEKAFVIKPMVDHALGEEMFAPELLQRVGPERRGGGIGEEAACVREFVVARFQFRHGLAHALGIFDLEGDEAGAALAIGIADQGVEGGVVGRELRVAASGGMFEEKLRRVSGERWQQLTEIAGGALGYCIQGASRLKVSGMDESRFVASRSASISAPISR